ncbi:MAG: alpha-1,2-fucosyltransferase [Butyrivibrio sp.]|nr:alpha-1,2-fucosyltransferase [Butyrivibrio sp.]
MTSDKHIVRIYGGLGNQLFQYALYKKFEYMGYETYADTSEIRRGVCGRNYQLDILGIRLKEAAKKDISAYYAGNKFTKALIKRIGKQTYYRQRDLFYNEKILETKHGYFDGYWQNDKYFKDISDVIKSSICFPDIDKEDTYTNNIFSEISKRKNTVSIHVRLGDYEKLSDIYGGICTLDYYEKAIGYIKDKKEMFNGEEPLFYVFSNDIKKAEEILNISNAVFVRGHSESDGYIDMNLMSMCNHHIIANSSFSWWGAYLGEKADSITVAPSKWMKDIDAKEVVPLNWHLI